MSVITSEVEARFLGEICHFDNGGTPSKKVDGYWNGNIPWITSTEVSNGSIAPARSSITKEGVNNSAAKLVPAGTLILVTRTGVGKTAIAPYDLAFSQDITALTPESNLLDTRYLYRFICGQTNYFNRFSRGATIKGITRDVLKNLKIPLPPLSEQKRIADILDKADTLRRKRREAIEEVENIVHSAFIDLFGNPITNPKEWPVLELGDVISLLGGFAFKSTDYSSEGIPLIRIGNANNQVFTPESLVYLPADYKKQFSRYVLEPNDMIITLTGTVGKDDYANIVNVPNTHDHWFLNQRVAKVSLENEEISKQYLIQFLKLPHIKAQIRKMNRGVRQANLRNDDILSQIIPVPPKSLQQKYEHAITQHSKLQNEMLVGLGEADDLFNSLVQRAFKGEL